MTRENLQSASDRLGAAAEDASGDLAERLQDQAERLHALAEREYSIDHGTLARVETKLGHLEDDAPDAIAEAISAAHDDVIAFRSTVEGV